MGTGGERKPGTGRKRRKVRSRSVRRREQQKERQAAAPNEGRNGKKKKQKRAAFDILSGTVLIVAVCVFVFSLYQLVMILVPYYTGGKE